ncbi:MAG: hypothetical protein JNL90_15000 [Planctomycetes bacterium]|nr:hypothetical protein [Planctomycetota bacterium]
MIPTPDRRTTLLVDRKFQLRLIGRLALILAANLVLFFALSIGMPAAVGFVGGAPTWGILELFTRLDLLALAVLLPLAGTFLVLLGQGLRETLRIAGPEVRLRQVFGELRSLRLPRAVAIRRDDHLQETVRDLSAALGALHGHVETMQAVARAAADAPAERSLAKWRELGALVQQFTLLGALPDADGAGKALALAEAPVASSAAERAADCPADSNAP